MKVLCDQLVTKEKERQQLLEMLKSSDGLPAPSTSKTQSGGGTNQPADSVPEESTEPEEDVPEWEKKLAKLEKK
jgi:hypothetical protein